MSFAEILSEIPRLSFAERQEWVRSASAVDDAELTAEENAPPDARMEDFTPPGRRGHPAGGTGSPLFLTTYRRNELRIARLGLQTPRTNFGSPV